MPSSITRCRAGWRGQSASIGEEAFDHPGEGGYVSLLPSGQHLCETMLCPRGLPRLARRQPFTRYLSTSHRIRSSAFEDSVHGLAHGAAAERAGLLALTVALTAVLAFALFEAAEAVDLTRADANDWVEHATLNAFALSIILHVGVGRRWPFAPAGQ
jgi:hypothetical protein